MNSRSREKALTDFDVDLVRQTYGYSVEEARNVLAQRMTATEWFKGLEFDDGARRALQDFAEVRTEGSLKTFWWGMCHFASEDGVKITLSCRLGGPVILNEQHSEKR